MAPCFILLDNLEAVIGLPPQSPGQSPRGRYGSRRTQHRAIDRMLSALLMEIDGVRHGQTDILQPADQPPVIVIATTETRSLLDRFLFIILFYFLSLMEMKFFR